MYDIYLERIFDKKKLLENVLKIVTLKIYFRIKLNKITKLRLSRIFFNRKMQEIKLQGFLLGP